MCTNQVLDVGEDDVDCGGACGCCTRLANTSACDAGVLSGAPVGSDVLIDCLLDLDGSSVDVVASNLLYRGGAIMNGELVASTPVRIAGSLLGLGLSLSGDFSLYNSATELVFCPSQWNVTQGDVPLNVATDNRDALNSFLTTAASVGAATVQLDDLDLLVEVAAASEDIGERWITSVSIPSNLHLRMSDTVHLRVFPTAAESYALLTSFMTNGTSITGGHLHGDRFAHDYSSGGSHISGTVIEVTGSHDILIEDVSVYDSPGAGIAVTSLQHRNVDGSPDYSPISTPRGSVDAQYPQNVTIRGCSVTACRTRAIVVLDVEGALIEDCNLSLTGHDVGGNASGVYPRLGLELRSVHFDQGTSLRYVVTDVTVRGNQFVDNVGGDLSLSRSNHVHVANNVLSSSIDSYAAHHVEVVGNTMAYVSSEADTDTSGISAPGSFFTAGPEEGNPMAHNWSITNNSITGYNIGMDLSAVSVSAHGNEVTDCKTGIRVSGHDTTILDNVVRSNRASGVGLTSFPTGAKVSNLLVDENLFDITGTSGYGMDLYRFNATGGTSYVTNTDFTARVRIRESINVVVTGCSYPSIIYETGNTDVTVENNTLT
jgi:hypothetical protein